MTSVGRMSANSTAWEEKHVNSGSELKQILINVQDKSKMPNPELDKRAKFSTVNATLFASLFRTVNKLQKHHFPPNTVLRAVGKLFSVLLFPDLLPY